MSVNIMPGVTTKVITHLQQNLISKMWLTSNICEWFYYLSNIEDKVELTGTLLLTGKPKDTISNSL